MSFWEIVLLCVVVKLCCVVIDSWVAVGVLVLKAWLES